MVTSSTSDPHRRLADAYRGRRVLVTGHTGFKGSWLTAWLLKLGAEVTGFSLPEPPTSPSHFGLCRLDRHVRDLRGDVRDHRAVRALVAEHRPEVVFHLAAQALVLRSVREPRSTFEANAGGAVNLLEAVREAGGVRSLVCVTTDKVYRNRSWPWGYRESDRLGGSDPYSASKAMAELALDAYRDTFFPPERHGEHGLALASARAGNVVGGGDFAEHRLVPDCMRALAAGEPIAVRNPESVRPWQLVLEPLSGYLWLGARLLEDGPAYGEAWNFGPPEPRGIPAAAVAEELVALWGSGSWRALDAGLPAVETAQLRLSWDKAAARLGWRPVRSWREALQAVVEWHRAFASGGEGGPDLLAYAGRQIDAYAERARALELPWAGGDPACYPAPPP